MTGPFPEFSQSPAELALDPEMLANELAEEFLVDPLDDLDALETEQADVAAECDLGLQLLQGGHDERMQGLRIFCEHRDPRAAAQLLPLLALLQNDSNGYVRKAVAWSLSSYPDAPVMNPLIRALETDIAAVRLWAASSLADAGATGLAKADQAAGRLLQALRIDSEPVVRSNSAWSLGRLYGDLVEPRQKEVVEALLGGLLHDTDMAVRDEARLALEQLEDPLVLERLQTLVDEGLLA